VNIILVSDSLAKSRSVSLSQTQVALIAFGILLAGFLLATATYFATMQFAVDVRNPYLRSLVSTLHKDDMKRAEADTRPARVPSRSDRLSSLRDDAGMRTRDWPQA